jgi:uncharacterized protein
MAIYPLHKFCTIKMTNTAIIYHQAKKGIDCPDGIAAAWVAKRAHPDADLIGCVYGDRAEVVGYSTLIIVDFSFPAYYLEAWAETKHVIVIDHHKTAWENLQNLSNQVTQRFDMNECGATLTWKYFFPTEPEPAFLSYIKDRDLWNFKLPYTHEIHEAMSSIGRSLEFFDSIATHTRNDLIRAFAPLGEKLLQPKREAIQKAADRVEFGTVAEWGNIPFVRTSPEEDRLISDICTTLYKKYHLAPFVACLNSDGITWSLRSDKNGGNFDVGTIAKDQGGGGHRNAAGFKSAIEPPF